MDGASRYHPRAEQAYTDTKAQHSPLTLPQELYDDAMAYIDTDRDIFTLYSCALVCRAWVPGARRFTHHTLRIPCHITPREIELFNLLDSPHCTLFPNVRKVIFDGTPARLGIAPPDDEWMWPFTRLQSRFTGVRALEFLDIDVAAKTSDGWDAFWKPDKNMAWLEGILDLTFVRVSFMCFVFVMHRVHQCANLERLKLVRDSAGYPIPIMEPAWARETPVPESLRELNIMDTQVPMWIVLANTAPAPQLRVLKLAATVNFNDYDLWDTIDLVSGTLEVLEFHVSSAAVLDAIFSGILHRTSLRQVRMAGLFYLFRERKRFFSQVRACMSLLANIPADQLLQITFDVYFADYMAEGWQLMPEDRSFWTELDMFLAGATFPALEQVRFVVVRDARNITKSVLHELLPLCVELNRIQIDNLPWKEE
ncbi:hypothetical protein K523DRAFT_11789 [Schizophyllum commune Tattone D]|nr:hypothetical protein K523DRAFT_11789 [Schizophyllum commune Tattone D]